MAVIFHNEIVDDKVLALTGILTHVEGEKLVERVFAAQCHTVETDIGTNESAELFRRYFTETFESCNFSVSAEAFYCSDAFLVSVALVGIFLIVLIFPLG